MKKVKSRSTILFIISIFLITSNILSQTSTTLDINDIKTIATGDRDDFHAMVSIKLIIKENHFNNSRVNTTNSSSLQFQVKDVNSNKVLVQNNNIEVKRGQKAIRFEITINEETKSFLPYLRNSQEKFYIEPSNDLVITLSNSNILTIKKQTIIDVTKQNRYLLPPNMINEIISEDGLTAMHETKFDFASTVDQDDSLSSKGIATFSYSRVSPFKKGIIQVSGNIATNKNDPTSFISIKQTLNLSTLNAEAGYESNQNGNEKRATLNIHGSKIGSNFIDLTNNYDRLRLKPSYKYGVSGYYYTKTEMTEIKEEFLVEPYLSIYYYIPVMEKHYILLDADFFYRSNENFEFLKDNARWKWEVTLGIKVKDGAPKIMAKYAGGTNSVTFEKDSKALLGLVMDLFPAK